MVIDIENYDLFSPVVTHGPFCLYLSKKTIGITMERVFVLYKIKLHCKDILAFFFLQMYATCQRLKITLKRDLKITEEISVGASPQAGHVYNPSPPVHKVGENEPCRGITHKMSKSSHHWPSNCSPRTHKLPRYEERQYI